MLYQLEAATCLVCLMPCWPSFLEHLNSALMSAQLSRTFPEHLTRACVASSLLSTTTFDFLADGYWHRSDTISTCSCNGGSSVMAESHSPNPSGWDPRMGKRQSPGPPWTPSWPKLATGLHPTRLLPTCLGPQLAAPRPSNSRPSKSRCFHPHGPNPRHSPRQPGHRHLWLHNSTHFGTHMQIT